MQSEDRAQDVAEDERAEREDEGDASDPAEARKSGPFGGLSPREAALRRAQKAREARAARDAEAATAKLTLRQRLGLSLSKLSQEELDAVVKALAARAANGEEKAVHALARLADQAFGKPQEEEKEEGDGTLEAMTRAQRAALLARLQEEEERERVLGQGEDVKEA